MTSLRLICAAALLAAALAAQKPQKKSAADQPVKTQSEDEALEEALSEAGSSAVEYARTLERHLKRFPTTEKKGEITRVLAQAALEQKDAKRLLRYAVPVLDEGNRNLALLDYTCRALLERAAEGDASKALGYARRMSVIATEQRKEWDEDRTIKTSKARRMEELDAATGRALWHAARALRMTGERDAALEAIGQSWAASPLEATARERSLQLDALGRKPEAAAALADAIATGGLDLTASADRLRLESLAGDQAGAILIEAWARSEKRNREREARFRQVDPNFGAKNVLDFTLSATVGDPLPLKSLLGKVVVIDFWATWCGPCRAQHPLYEEVKRKFADRKDVVFLAISTDENRESVPGFLEAMGWPKLTYYEDGLATSQRISSIPTTMILDKEGGVASRLHGFAADRFVDMLTARIKEVLGEGE